MSSSSRARFRWIPLAGITCTHRTHLADLSKYFLTRNSTVTQCSAAKPAFVERVERAGKALIAGIAVSAVLASVRFDTFPVRFPFPSIARPR
jgi:hypothetical protein